MDRLHTARLGFAVASCFVFVYLGSVITMLTVSKEQAVRLFNSVVHGVDFTSIIRWQMPWSEMIVGMLQVFLFGWLFGAGIAIIYNLGVRQRGSGHE